MSNEFDSLLDATIGHLQNLKSGGAEFVNVDLSLLAQLKAPSCQTMHQPQRPPASGRSTAPGALPGFAPAEVSPTVRPTPTASGTAATAIKSVELAPAQKEAAMAELRCQVLQCQKCAHLASSRKNVVFGIGTVHTELMFVGEAPGADEDEQGEPFVGKAGQLLTKIIQTMGYTRETVFIANILKCRPNTPGQVSGNRKPTPDEMATCMSYLLSQIEIIRPRVIVALGATAVEGLFGKTVGITRLRGNWQTFQGIPVMPTYHPAYLLRNQALSEKRRVWEDMLQVLEKLQRPISDKQRGYFLRAN